MAKNDTKFTQNNILFYFTIFQGDICWVLHGWESHHKGDFSFSRHISKLSHFHQNRKLHGNVVQCLALE